MARTTGPKKAFFRFCFSRIFEIRKTENSQHIGAFFPGLFFTFFAGIRGRSGAQTQRHHSKFQKSRYLMGVPAPYFSLQRVEVGVAGATIVVGSRLLPYNEDPYDNRSLDAVGAMAPLVRCLYSLAVAHTFIYT